jgi:putative MATE family efflux protein
VAGLTDKERIVSGPIARTVISLAVPVTLGMLMEIALSVTNFYWVGRLGATAQDAVTSSMVIIWTVYAAISMITIGITALVARYVGADDLESAKYYIHQAFWLALVVGAVVSVIGFVLTPAALQFMQTSPATAENATPYLRIFFATAILPMLEGTAFAIFRASGDTRTPTKVAIATVVANMALDPLFIFGWGPVPAMGVMGASVANAISYSIGIAYVSYYWFGGKLGYRMSPLFRVRPQLAAMGKIALIGLPISSQQMAFNLVYWFLIKYVHRFGEAAGAAMGIGNRMESLSYLTCYGFSLAASTMVGQNLGAGKPDRAAKGAWGAVGLGIGVTSVLTVLFLTIPGLLTSVFTDDPQVRAIARDYLMILGLSQLAMAVEIILEGAFSGAGDTVPPMIVSIPGAALRIPLAWFLAFSLGLGVNGIWWSLTITSIVKAVALAWWFGLGRWKARKL